MIISARPPCRRARRPGVPIREVRRLNTLALGLAGMVQREIQWATLRHFACAGTYLGLGICRRRTRFMERGITAARRPRDSQPDPCAMVRIMERQRIKRLPVMRKARCRPRPAAPHHPDAHGRREAEAGDRRLPAILVHLHGRAHRSRPPTTAPSRRSGPASSSARSTTASAPNGAPTSMPISTPSSRPRGVPPADDRVGSGRSRSGGAGEGVRTLGAGDPQ